MWDGGPLRQWAERRVPSNWVQYVDGWVGMHVCEECGRPSPGGIYSEIVSDECRRIDEFLRQIERTPSLVSAFLVGWASYRLIRGI